MKKVFLISLIGLTFLGFSCQKENQATEVNIRLKNVSSIEYTDIVVSLTHMYNDLAVGESSEYQVYESAYGYAAISLKANGEEYRLQPIDFVGEAQLENGNYTYELEAVKLNGANFIKLELKED
ncbi:MAG: hypothetical protein ACI8VT_001162 [Saprospiraceae bacterium]|jgi:hypothetical protein